MTKKQQELTTAWNYFLIEFQNSVVAEVGARETDPDCETTGEPEFERLAAAVGDIVGVKPCPQCMAIGCKIHNQTT